MGISLQFVACSPELIDSEPINFSELIDSDPINLTFLS
jgi:hypothetical protein